MKTSMRSMVWATMMAGGLGLVACSSSPTGPQLRDDTGGDKTDGGKQDVGVDTPDKDVGVDTNPGTDIGVDVDTGGAPVSDPDVSQFLDPDHIPNTDQVIVGTLMLPTGPNTFKYVAYWADPNEAVFTNKDGTDGFHAYALFPATEQASRSRDHSKWVYASGTSREYGTRLLVVNQDGKGLRLLKDDTLYQDRCTEILPEFSPKGDWVYYSRSCDVLVEEYPGIPREYEYQFRARVEPRGEADDVQPVVARNVLHDTSPGSPSQMLFGHPNGDGSKFIAQEISVKSSYQSVVYSIDTTTMIGTKVIELVEGFDMPNTNGPGIIYHFVMPAAEGELYFMAILTDVQPQTEYTSYRVMKMASDGTLSTAFPISRDSSFAPYNWGYSLSPIEQDRFTFLGVTRLTPDGQGLEYGMGICGLDGTGVRYSDQRGIDGRFTSWNP